MSKGSSGVKGFKRKDVKGSTEAKTENRVSFAIAITVDGKTFLGDIVACKAEDFDKVVVGIKESEEYVLLDRARVSHVFSKEVISRSVISVVPAPAYIDFVKSI